MGALDLSVAGPFIRSVIGGEQNADVGLVINRGSALVKSRIITFAILDASGAVMSVLCRTMMFSSSFSCLFIFHLSNILMDKFGVISLPFCICRSYGLGFLNEGSMC